MSWALNLSAAMIRRRLALEARPPVLRERIDMVLVAIGRG